MNSRQANRPVVAALREELRISLADSPEVDRFIVAFSGGADSLALLHAFSSLREASPTLQVAAVHVHHGLHERADAWAEHCRRVARFLDVALEIVEVDARAGGGESPEAAARAARYGALASRVDARSAVCTAHHQRDQAETLLLQLFRGAGPKGLSAMPRVSRLGAGWLLRPFLHVPAARLVEYARASGLEWVEDPANADPRFGRYHVRHEILPRLEARWPAAVATLAGAARLQAEAAELIAAQAARDLEGARGSQPGTLAVSALRALTPARGRAAMRAWLARQSLPLPGRARLESVMEQLLGARDDACPLVAWPGAEVRRYGGDIYVAAPPSTPADVSLRLPWRPPRSLALPLGRLHASRVRGHGLDASLCEGARMEVRFRRGGERCRPAGRGRSQALKKLLQAYRVPPWLRDRVPLVYVNDELAAVVGLWVCEGFQARPDAPGWDLRWLVGDAAGEDVDAPGG